MAWRTDHGKDPTHEVSEQRGLETDHGKDPTRKVLEQRDPPNDKDSPSTDRGRPQPRDRARLLLCAFTVVLGSVACCQVIDDVCVKCCLSPTTQN